MVWWIAKKTETDDIIEIIFSYEDGNPDGRVTYDKKIKKLKITKVPDNCKDIIVESVCQFIWRLMKNGELTEKGSWIITG